MPSDSSLLPAPPSFSGFCPIAPIPKGRPRFGNGITYTDPKTRKYEEAARKFFKEAYGTGYAPMDGPIAVEYEFVMPRPKSIPIIRWFCHSKPDIDNLVKSFQDAMDFKMKSPQGTILGVIANDSRVAVMSASKRYAEDGEECGTRFSISHADEEVIIVGDGIGDMLGRALTLSMRRYDMMSLMTGGVRKNKAVRRVYVFPDSNGLPAAFDDRLKKAFPECEELVVI